MTTAQTPRTGRQEKARGLRANSATACVLAALLAAAGCNSTGSVLSTARPDPTPGAAIPGATPLAPPDSQSATLAAGAQQMNAAAGQQAPIANRTRVQFAPVIGATAQSVPALSRRLTTRANQRGIEIVEQNSSAPILMKGYFSAIADGGKTTVVYVWDVLDPSGNRLHRIQGQAATPGGRGDGWSSVTPATMETVADSTIDELANWLAKSQT